LIIVQFSHSSYTIQNIQEANCHLVQCLITHVSILNNYKEKNTLM